MKSQSLVKNKAMGRYLFILGFAILIISILLPESVVNQFGAMKPVAYTSLIICPLLGIVGLLFSIKNKDLIYGILNGLLIVSFPLVMFIGYALFG